MTQTADIRRFGEHHNAFGFLRLLFASLVIVSHTPEMADGDRRREWMTQIFGTMSFGEVAVDGFFLISGYLIVGSYLKQPGVWAYLQRRIARIYPGFIVASIVTIVIVAPLAGVHLADIMHGIVSSIARIVTLRPPSLPGAFPRTYYAGLNDATWTISYEFRCYLLVILLGVVGAFRYPAIIAALAGAIILFQKMIPASHWQFVEQLPYPNLYIGEVDVSLRLTAAFLIGSLFFLLREHYRFHRISIAFAALILVPSMFVELLARPILLICGGYLMFAFAAWGSSGVLSKINNRNDISYGVYLYSWPIAKLILFYRPSTPLPGVMILTFVAACCCGWLSWIMIERPAMRLLQIRTRRRSPAGHDTHASRER